MCLAFVPSNADNPHLVLTDINYFTKVLPFLAAVDSDMLGMSSNQGRLLPAPKDRRRFVMMFLTVNYLSLK